MGSADPSAELVQIAAGASLNASEALSFLVREDVEVRGPDVYYLTSPADLKSRFGSASHLYAVTQTVYGAEAPGVFSLALGRDSAPHLIRLLIGERGSGTCELSGMELDALKETANVVSGSYLATLAYPLGLSGAPSLPDILHGPLEELMPAFAPPASALCVESRFVAPSKQVELVVLVTVARESPPLAATVSPQAVRP